MPDPFDFRWGPSRLVGLGVRLEPDQAAVTETEGYALAIVPVHDPTFEEPQKILDSNDQVISGPIIVKTILNGPAYQYRAGAEPATHQDVLDADLDPEWRKYAQAVGDYDGGIDRMWLSKYEVLPAWDTVMITEDQAKRFEKEIGHIWGQTAYPALCHWAAMVDDRLYSHDTEWDYDELEQWLRVCQTLRVDPALEPYTDPSSYPAPLPSEIEPVWKFDDADLNKLWEGVKKSSYNSWAAMEAVQPAQERTLWRYRNEQEIPWW